MNFKMPELADTKGSQCRHDGLRSTTTHYDHRAGVLCFVLVCDACGAEVQEVARFWYRPRFRPDRVGSIAA